VSTLGHSDETSSIFQASSSPKPFLGFKDKDGEWQVKMGKPSVDAAPQENAPVEQAVENEAA